MQEAESLSKNDQLAEKRNFKGNCEILRTIFQPRALPSDIPASWEGVIYFITLRLVSTTRTPYCVKEKLFSEDHSTFAAKQIQLDSLLDFITL